MAAITEFPGDSTVYEIWAQNGGGSLILAQHIVGPDDATTLNFAKSMVVAGEFTPYPGAAICHVENGVRIVDVQPADVPVL